MRVDAESTQDGNDVLFDGTGAIRIEVNGRSSVWTAHCGSATWTPDFTATATATAC